MLHVSAFSGHAFDESIPISIGGMEEALGELLESLFVILYIAWEMPITSSSIK